MQKRIFMFFIFSTMFFYLSPSTQAQILQNIRLKDGSLIKGYVLDLSEGTYTIQTNDLGEIKIEQDKIISLSVVTKIDENVSSQKYDEDEQGSSLGDVIGNNFQPKVQQVQQKIMSNPDMMLSVGELLKNENVVQILSDPTLIQQLMSGDPAEVQNNPKVKQLLNNPDMQSLINKLMQDQ